MTKVGLAKKELIQNSDMSITRYRVRLAGDKNSTRLLVVTSEI